jgi:hypothetical protein
VALTAQFFCLELVHADTHTHTLVYSVRNIKRVLDIEGDVSKRADDTLRAQSFFSPRPELGVTEVAFA